MLVNTKTFVKQESPCFCYVGISIGAWSHNSYVGTAYNDIIQYHCYIGLCPELLLSRLPIQCMGRLKCLRVGSKTTSMLLAGCPNSLLAISLKYFFLDLALIAIVQIHSSEHFLTYAFQMQKTQMLVILIQKFQHHKISVEDESKHMVMI